MKNTLVVMLSGKIDSGKNTTGAALLEIFGNRAVTDALARPLKEMCRDVFGPLTSYLAEHHGIETQDEEWFEKKTALTRILLQTVGTDIVHRIDKDYWIKQTISAIENSPAEIYIITDWRFPNESEKIEAVFKIFKIRVTRRIPRPEGFHEHVSETALDDYEGFDESIDGSYGMHHASVQTNIVADKIIKRMQS